MASPLSGTADRPAPLSAHQILHAWEAGRRQHAVDRALTLLAAADPGEPPDRLASLMIGERDRRLIELRRTTFGERLPSRAECPECSERLEFTVRADEIRTAPDDTPSADPARHELEIDGYALTFRPPDSRDLAAAATAGTVDEARQSLLERCLTGARRGGKEVAAVDLPEAVVVQLVERVAAADPQAEVLIDLACPACDTRWQLQFDIASYFWTEISNRARRLLEEVHVLASAYGWSEAEILSMPAARRRLYREFLGA